MYVYDNSTLSLIIRVSKNLKLLQHDEVLKQIKEGLRTGFLGFYNQLLCANLASHEPVQASRDGTQPARNHFVRRRLRILQFSLQQVRSWMRTLMAPLANRPGSWEYISCARFLTLGTWEFALKKKAFFVGYFARSTEGGCVRVIWPPGERISQPRDCVSSVLIVSKTNLIGASPMTLETSEETSELRSIGCVAPSSRR